MNEVIITKRLRKRSAPVALLTYVIHNLGGPQKASVMLSKELGEEITHDRLMLWRVRGSVSMPYVKRVAEALKVSPYCLNFKGYRRFTGERIEWKAIVEKCTKLSPIQRRDVLTKKAPE